MSGTLIDAYGARKAECVMRETWGHMDANPGTRYNGTILFAEGLYTNDGVIALNCDFGNAGYGPWFHQGLQFWLSEQETEPGQVYRFDGFYRLAKGGRHKFVGTITTMALVTA